MSLYIQPSKQKYDVAIVGSGAGGGMASKILSEAGLSVAVLEAGGFYDPAMEEYRTQLRWPWESPRRGASVVRPFGVFVAAWGGWVFPGVHYTNYCGTYFDWFCFCLMVGKTILY